MRLPSISTVQAPHWPWSQPFLVPVRSRCWRKRSSSVVQGATASCLLWPLIVRITAVASGKVGALIWVLELTSIVSQPGWLPANQRACARANSGPCRVRLLTVLLGQHAGRRDGGDGGLEL